jgi:hypothetical protein
LFSGLTNDGDKVAELWSWQLLYSLSQKYIQGGVSLLALAMPKHQLTPWSYDQFLHGKVLLITMGMPPLKSNLNTTVK